MAKKLKESTILELSRRVVAHALLPHGSAIRFSRRKTDRQVRADFTVKRQHVTAANLAIPSDSDTVSTLLANVGAILSTDLNARGIDMKLYGPNGEYFVGQTHIGTVRSIPGRCEDNADDTVELLAQLVENADIDVEFSLRDLGALYRELHESLGDGFERALLKNAAKIRAKGLSS